MHAEQQEDAAVLSSSGPALFQTFHPHLQRIIARAFEAAPTLSDTPTVAVGSTTGGDMAERTAQLLELLLSFLEFACSPACGGPATDRVAAVLKMALSPPLCQPHEYLVPPSKREPPSHEARKSTAVELGDVVLVWWALPRVV